MKDIEKRAEKYAGDNWIDDDSFNACVDGYIIGAKEQKKIDIEKAIEWIEYNNENGGCNFDNWKTKFRKYMKG